MEAISQTERSMTSRTVAEDLHRDTRWAHFVTLLLGIWLIATPFALGYLDPVWSAEVARVTATRHLPDPALRNAWLTGSDVVSGVLVMLFAAFSLSRRTRWAQWANVFVGLWLLAAPLIFWAPSPAAYLNDTLLGALVIAFAILIPPTPGINAEAEASRIMVPPGWDYNPSSGLQRVPIIVLALLGFLISRYLTAYQLGYIRAAWDPFFGDGTMKIIGSHLSRQFPVPDAGMGALVYLLEVLSGFKGDQARWRSMPWMVALFGALVVPLGAVSIFFIIIQPILFGTLCSLCLVAALAMVIMIPHALDEVAAIFQFLLAEARRGGSWWRIFWRGGTADGDSVADHVPERGEGRAMLRGVHATWGLAVCTGIGVWLMFTPLALHLSGFMAAGNHVVGSLVITFSVIAMAEVGRPLRFVNVPCGLWLIVSPWLLGASGSAVWANVVAGGLLILAALPRGPIHHRYGIWNRYIV